jgi:hypothetical protein
MLENLSTRERIRVPDLTAVGPQIESWLATLGQPAEPVDTVGDSAEEAWP